jgi:hypothetical protein
MYHGYYTVEVNYVFKNTGSAKSIVMGFPSSSKMEMNFRAYDGEKELAITSVNTDWEFDKPSTGRNYMRYPLDEFKCHTVEFIENEEKHIKNTYSLEYDSPGRHEPNISFYYIITTGAFWKGSITSIEVRVDSENAPFNVDLNKATFNGNKVSLKGFYEVYKNIEPKEDLSFMVPLKKDALVYGNCSSFLSSNSSNNYNGDNVADGNESTAWVEGKDDAGIGEQLYFYNPYGGVGKVKTLAIINGYSKNQTTFKNNNRVACIRVKGKVQTQGNYEEWAQEGESYMDFIQKHYGKRVMESTSALFILDDSMEIQYLHFDHPIEADHLTIEIVDVYKGDKYDDTAISEIMILSE